MIGGERGPVTLVAFKAIDSVLRGQNGGFDSHTLPPILISVFCPGEQFTLRPEKSSSEVRTINSSHSTHGAFQLDKSWCKWRYSLPGVVGLGLYIFQCNIDPVCLFLLALLQVTHRFICNSFGSRPAPRDS